MKRKFADGGQLLGRLNKPAKEGFEYRAPRQTNARDYTPNLKEDVVSSTKADLGKAAKGMGTSPFNKMTGEAAARGVTRLASRAGLAGTALAAGAELGRYIDEKTGIGRKMVDKVLGPAKYDGDRVEVSENSKRRIAAGELEEKKDKDDGAGSKVKAKAVPYPKSEIRETVEDDNRPSYKDTEGTGDRDEESNMRKGGKVKKYAKGGSIDGCAQRGKTRGTVR